MYLIPENQKGVYLKEISTLARALKDTAVTAPQHFDWLPKRVS